MSDLRTAALRARDALALWSIGRDMDAVALNDLIAELDAALAGPQEPDRWGAGYEAGYAAGVAERPAAPIIQPEIKDDKPFSQASIRTTQTAWKMGFEVGKAEAQALQDAVVSGLGISCGGKHIDPNSIYKHPEIKDDKPLKETTQPNTLRLADSISRIDTLTDHQRSELLQAAAELRRLYAKCELQKTVPTKYQRMEFNAQLQMENDSLRTPPEAKTAAEKIAYCAGWWAAMETKREDA